MVIQSEIKLTQPEVLSLLQFFDDSSDKPLHEGLDFSSYSEKLSKHAFFVLATDDNELKGFIAYYLNDEGHFVYIPQIVVHKSARHLGLGHMMMKELVKSVVSMNGVYTQIQLEVLKENDNASNFYSREGFDAVEDRKERLLLISSIK